MKQLSEVQFMKSSQKWAVKDNMIPEGKREKRRKENKRGMTERI